MKRILTIACLLFASAAGAQTYPSVDLQLHGLSYHLHHQSSEGYTFNQRNGGFGVRVNFSDSLDAQLGYYDNSYRRDTNYIVVDYMPLHYDRTLSAGIFAGVVDHYNMINNGNFTPAGGFVARKYWGIFSITTRAVPSVRPKQVTFVAAEAGIALPF